jgi:hypothetical protein
MSRGEPSETRLALTLAPPRREPPTSAVRNPHMSYGCRVGYRSPPAEAVRRYSMEHWLDQVDFDATSVQGVPRSQERIGLSLVPKLIPAHFSASRGQ